jgi:lipopolysaccharide export system ATP-binding protein
MDSEMRALVENYLLATSGLKKFYGQRTVVDGVSIHVKPGEIVGLLGPNGAGKTTTFNMVVGLVKPDEGEIYYRNQLVTSLPIHRRARLGVGYLTQEPSVFRKLTVRQNILAILETRKVPRGEMRHRMDHLLEELELTHVANSMAYQLSGGEKRRLEITRALVCNPQLFLLDEPFAGIDPLAVFEVQKIVRQLSQRGMGVLITDHNAREMLKLVDRAYILVQGRVLMEGTSSFLAESSQARDIYLGPDFN